MTQTVNINELFSPTGLASQVLCIDRSPGLERAKVMHGNLLIIGKYCWKVGAAIILTVSLEVQLLIFPGDFKLDINNYSSFLNFARCMLLEFHGQLKQLYELNIAILLLLVNRFENSFDRHLDTE